MPIYEYRCKDENCGKTTEKLQRISDSEKPPPECPECKGETKRLISKTSFQLKGGGWASDGYSG
tara:strand:- start:1887 stop:2078 length:192 start_codon:yes stop_codon:yes gene_type:complete